MRPRDHVGFVSIIMSLSRQRSPRPAFIDLFSGVGGLTAGLEAAGWQSALAVEHWKDAVATYRSNFPSHKVYDGDVRDLSATKLARLVPGEVELVAGGPPCQGWSTVGRRQWDDDRNDLFTEFMRIVRIVRPRHFLIENVVGLRDMGAPDAVRELFASLGYQISVQIIRAVDFGVPQLRKRIIFAGSRDGLDLLPIATASVPVVSVWDAISDLPEVSAGETADEYTRKPQTAYQRKMRKGSPLLQGHTVSAHPPHLVKAISFIPNGGNRQAIPPELQPRSGFHNSYSRLASWRPAVAVTSNLGKPSGTRCIHPFQDRGLTAREGARLQSFQDRFHFAGGIVSQRLQIANAVPPLLAESLGRALLEASQWSGANEQSPLAA